MAIQLQTRVHAPAAPPTPSRRGALRRTSLLVATGLLGGFAADLVCGAEGHVVALSFAAATGEFWAQCSLRLAPLAQALGAGG